MRVQREKSPLGSFSQYVYVPSTGQTFVSGMIGMNSEGDVPASVTEQSELIFGQLEGILQGLGGDLSNVIKLISFHIDLEDYADYSAVRARTFEGFLPASSAVGVAELLLGAKVEVEALALVPPIGKE